MPTFQQVQTAFDATAKAAVQGAVVGAGWIPGNVNDTTYAAGTVPYVKGLLIQQSNAQMGLGDIVARRIRGTAVFIIHVKKGTGMGQHTIIRDALENALGSKVIGGATFQNPRATTLGEKETWSLTGVEVPFYFDR